MGTVRNRLTIVQDYDYDLLNKVRNNAVDYFEKVLHDEGFASYDVGSQMISPILSSLINEEYTFVIMGDCGKSEFVTSGKFEKYREAWIEQNKKSCQNILVADFGEGDTKAFIEEY